jgi:hypothetical protein
MIYYQVVPGDCGSTNFDIGSSQVGVALGISTAARSDPEPISRGILTGINTVFGLFGAAHVAAIQTEEKTLCQIAVAYNATAVALESGVSNGQITPDQASGILGQAVTQLDARLQMIYKPCNAACGYRMALNAMLAYSSDIVFPALQPSIPVLGALFAPTPLPGSRGAPGTIPGNVTGSPSAYQGASGFTPTPLTGVPGVPGSIPSNLPVGALILIGGILYIASRPRAVKAAVSEAAA